MIEKIISDCSVKLILDNLSKKNLVLPLNERDLDELLDYFELMESSLSDRKAGGENIDCQLLIMISDCVDEISIYDDEEFIDFDKLNERLKKLQKVE